MGLVLVDEEGGITLLLLLLLVLFVMFGKFSGGRLNEFVFPPMPPDAVELEVPMAARRDDDVVVVVVMLLSRTGGKAIRGNIVWCVRGKKEKKKRYK